MNGQARILSVTLPARAKLNLRLEVLGRRSDGYHEVDTLMHSIALADQVKISLAAPAPPSPRTEDSDGVNPMEDAHPAVDIKLTLDCQPDLGLAPPDNLAFVAAGALLRAWRASGGALPGGAAVHVEIVKQIPVAAGLGGGSSDAAAVLRGLAALLSAVCAESRRQHGRVNLTVLAESLGSDVPFLVRGGAALGVGRGERLLPLQTSLAAPIVLLAPPYTVTAGDAYAWYDETAPVCGSTAPAGLLNSSGVHPQALSDVELLAKGLVHNDLTRVVSQRFPLLNQLIDELRSAGAIVAEMTGSGPVVFGVFASVDGAAAARREIARRHPDVRAIASRLDPRSESELPLRVEEELT